MSKYTYTFIDIPSQEKLGTLPLYGVNFSDLLLQGQGGASAGTFTGSIRMDSDFVSGPQEILDMTRPEATAIWVDLDEVPIWCGILWSRTYQSDGRVVQLNAQTFSSYLAKVVWAPANVLVSSYIMSDNPHNVIRYAYQYLSTEASQEYDVGIHLEDYHQDISVDFMEKQFIRSEHKYLTEAISDALKAGAEYRILPTMDASGMRLPLLQSGIPRSLGVTQNAADQGTPLQYPGDLSKYYLTNSSANAPTRLFGVGKTTGQTDLSYVAQGSITGRIGVDVVNSYETEDAAQLQLFTVNDLTSLQNDLNRPVYEVNGGGTGLDWAAGDYKRVVIFDPYRFPTPVGGVVRVVGWSLSPPDSGGVEQLGITIDDVSNLVALNV
jgi:hypothetical protein